VRQFPCCDRTARTASLRHIHLEISDLLAARVPCCVMRRSIALNSDDWNSRSISYAHYLVVVLTCLLRGAVPAEAPNQKPAPLPSRAVRVSKIGASSSFPRPAPPSPSLRFACAILHTCIACPLHVCRPAAPRAHARKVTKTNQSDVPSLTNLDQLRDGLGLRGVSSGVAPANTIIQKRWGQSSREQRTRKPRRTRQPRAPGTRKLRHTPLASRSRHRHLPAANASLAAGSDRNCLTVPIPSGGSLLPSHPPTCPSLAKSSTTALLCVPCRLQDKPSSACSRHVPHRIRVQNCTDIIAQPKHKK